MQFLAHCHNTVKLRFSTIKLYLAGIRYHYLRMNMSNPCSNSERIEFILRGIKKDQGAPNALRFPITSHILQDMCKLLYNGVFSPYTDVLLICVCTLAFFGFLRCGEFTVSTASNLQNVLQFCDVQMSQDESFYSLVLRSSKNDPFRKGVTLKLFRNSITHVCPVRAMTRYLNERRSNIRTIHSPLLVDCDGSVLSRDKFINYLKQILRILGLDDTKFNGHSFRIGAATSAAASGVEDHLIQTLGRWSSSCYTRYIRTSNSSLQDAQSKMCR